MPKVVPYGRQATVSKTLCVNRSSQTVFSNDKTMTTVLPRHSSSGELDGVNTVDCRTHTRKVKVRLGDSAYSSMVFMLDGNKVREGDSSYGPELVALGADGRVHRGDSSYGSLISNREGGGISGAAAAAFPLVR